MHQHISQTDKLLSETTFIITFEIRGFVAATCRSSIIISTWALSYMYIVDVHVVKRFPNQAHEGVRVAARRRPLRQFGYGVRRLYFYFLRLPYLYTVETKRNGI